MKKLIKLGFLLFVIVVFVSCNNDNETIYQTDNDKIEADLKKVVEDNNITKCTIYVYLSDFSQKALHSNVDFTISNGFLEITGYDQENVKYVIRYNLLYLVNYTIKSNQLYLNFNITTTYLTETDKIENELNNVIQENEITKCTVYTYLSDQSQKIIYSNVDFVISNGNLIISGTSYSGGSYETRFNLIYLATYTVRDGQLYLNFTNYYE